MTAQRTSARGKTVMSKRDMWLVAAGVLLVAVALTWWRAANGADTGTAILAGFSVIFIVGVALTANQWVARRRARRRSTS